MPSIWNGLGFFPSCRQGNAQNLCKKCKHGIIQRNESLENHCKSYPKSWLLLLNVQHKLNVIDFQHGL